ncbi:MAG: VCBS repeat-containing protein, partial [Phaeodactylibacter sp.]|nr:VCBS repeat-containing protein [Phaeodactylibacter sp.]
MYKRIFTALLLFICGGHLAFGQFGPQNTLTINTDEPRDVAAGDLTGDGYKDIVAISSEDGELMWFNNIGGQGLFTAKQTINQSNTEGSTVDLADLDNDGDLDILVGYGVDGNEVAWYENTNGFAAFGPKQIIGTAGTVRMVRAADIDGDGDLDVFAAAQLDDALIWFEHLDGQGT